MSEWWAGDVPPSMTEELGMSDRRPEKLLYVAEKKDWTGTQNEETRMRDATVDEVLSWVRRGVESGTIEGEMVGWCRVHRGNPRDCEHKAVYDEVCYVTPALVLGSDGGEDR